MSINLICLLLSLRNGAAIHCRNRVATDPPVVVRHGRPAVETETASAVPIGQIGRGTRLLSKERLSINTLQLEKTHPHPSLGTERGVDRASADGEQRGSCAIAQAEAEPGKIGKFAIWAHRPGHNQLRIKITPPNSISAPKMRIRSAGCWGRPKNPK